MRNILKINSIALALSPPLAVYSLFKGVDLASFVWLILLPVNFLMLTNKRLLNDPALKWLLAILFLTVFSSGHNYSDHSLVIHNLFPISICFGVIILLKNNIEIGVFKKVLIYVGCLASFICIYQRIQFITTGTYDNYFFIPGLEVKRELDTFSWYRPSAFFTEPAHLSIFLLPIYYWMLREKSFVLASIMAAGVLFSGSTTGFLLLIILFVYQLLLAIKREKGALIKYVILGTLVAFVIVYFSKDVFVANIDKLDNVESRENIRLLGGLMYIRNMDISEHLFGIGLNQLEGFCRVRGLPFLGNYSNAFIYSYLSYGIIGFLALVVYLIRVWNSSFKDRGFFIILLGVLASDQILFNRHLFYLLFFVFLAQVILDRDINGSSYIDKVVR